MGKFRDIFRSEHTYLPAVHVKDEEQALRNARTAREGGADGIMIVNHHPLEVPAARLFKIQELIQQELPGFPVIPNCLDLDFEVVRMAPPSTPGLWLDDQIIHMDDPHPTAQAETFLELRREVGFQGLYFGSVAFKGQDVVEHPGEAARLAADFVDVVTTSGPSTGHEPPVDQIILMSAASRSGGKPLAVASGISLINVELYKPYVDCFIIGTHISRNFWEFDPKRLAAMATRLGK